MFKLVVLNEIIVLLFYLLFWNFKLYNMKIQLFLFLISFVTFESFCQVNQSFTNAYHPYQGHILLTNSDGTHSTIFVNGGSATLVNPDGTQSTIDFGKNSSTLMADDGSNLVIYHNLLSSTIPNPDGTQIVVNHLGSSSSCSTQNENHTITHNYGHNRRRICTNGIDVLIHMNWLMQNKGGKVTKEFNNEELQNK